MPKATPITTAGYGIRFTIAELEKALHKHLTVVPIEVDTLGQLGDAIDATETGLYRITLPGQKPKSAYRGSIHETVEVYAHHGQAYVTLLDVYLASTTPKHKLDIDDCERIKGTDHSLASVCWGNLTLGINKLCSYATSQHGKPDLLVINLEDGVKFITSKAFFATAHKGKAEATFGMPDPEAVEFLQDLARTLGFDEPGFRVVNARF